MRVALLLALSACTIHNGNGTPDSTTVDLTEVVDVENEGSIEVYVETGATDESAEITCDSNLLQFIEAVTGDGSLLIKIADGVDINPKAPCRVDVAVATLESLSLSGSATLEGSGDLTGFQTAFLSGSGSLDVSGIVGTDVTITSTGSGELTAAGTADRIDVSLSGSGAIDAQDLAATDAIVHASGSGSVTVTASRDIEVHLSGSGAVDVYGNPAGTRVVDDSGSGTITIH